MRRELVVCFAIALCAGCGGGWWGDGGIKGIIAYQTEERVANASVYALPLRRVNQPAYYKITGGDGRYHLEGFDEGWWAICASKDRGLAWSDPIYLYDDDDLVYVDLLSPFIPIDGYIDPVDPARGYLMCASNIPQGPASTNGIFLITREGWQECYPFFEQAGWLYGPPSYNRARPGEVCFAAGTAGQKDIYRFDLFTGELYNLTNSPTVDENDPCYDPTGTEIAYTADALVDPYGYEELWVMGRDGGGRFVLLSDEIGGAYYDYATPSWDSANLSGTQYGSLAFSMRLLTQSAWSVAICSRDTIDLFYNLTGGLAGDDRRPVIHPGSTKSSFTIVYSKTADTAVPGVTETDLMNLTGGSIESTPAVVEYAIGGADFSGFAELEPSFSVDGSRVAFVSSASADELYTADYTRNSGTADMLSSIERWTLSSGGDRFVAPTIVGF